MLPALKVLKHPSQTRRGEAHATEHARANLRLILLETVAWTSAHAEPNDPTQCLRSPRLAPYLFNDSRHATVHDVASQRHCQLETEGRVRRIGGRAEDLVDVATIGLADAARLTAGGRLLVWERDTTIDDGAGQAETRGYLDESDMPPWDTWVAYVDDSEHAGGLISWVPPIFVAAVDSAIRVNAYGALYWLRDSKLPFAEVLRSENLLS
jgi:hypothetical protein